MATIDTEAYMHWLKSIVETKGGKFFGVKQAAAIAEAAPADPATESSTTFNIDVNWPVAPLGSPWVPTSEEVRTKASVTRYKLVSVEEGGVSTAVLSFDTTALHDYSFLDRAGYVYEVNTDTLGVQHIKFISTDATINNISGSR